MARKIPSDMVAGTRFETNGFGVLVVLKYNSHFDVEVEFLSTGFKTSARSVHIRSGGVKDKLKPIVYGVGFVGDGKFRPRKDSSAYSVWNGIIERCYSKRSQEIHPTYKEVTVCEEWHNFQNFAKWYYENHPKDGKSYHMDKDILSDPEAKIYSPNTCLFVTRYINNEESHAKNYTFTNPDGDVVYIYNLSKFCKENNLNRSHMYGVFTGKRAHHKGWKRTN